MSTNINPPVPSGNFRVGRNGWVPDLVVMHTTTSTTQSAINWITSPESNVSYHYIIAANGNVTSAVDIANTAFANGTNTSIPNLHPSLSTNHIVRSRTANANYYTISIGFGDMNLNNGHLTNAQINATAGMLNIIRADVMSRWNRWIDMSRVTVIGHNEVAPRYQGGGSRACPRLRPYYVPFPFGQILQVLSQMPILMSASSVYPMGLEQDTDQEYMGMLLKDGMQGVRDELDSAPPPHEDQDADQ